MGASLKVVISSFGSSGDFNPCLGLGRALRRRGVDVIFLSNPYYEKKILEAGLRFVPAGEYWDVFKEIADKPDFLHPQKGPRLVWKLVLETLPVMYSAMSDLIQKEKPDLIACHILEFGGMLAAIEQGIRYAVLSPTPMGWFSVSEPGHLTYSRLPLWVRRTQARTLRFLMNIAFRYQMKPYCRKWGIPNPMTGIRDCYNRAVLNLGFWSDFLRPNAFDDLSHSKICGFVRDEHIRGWPEVPDQIAQLFDNPERPIVVGLGSTASLHGDDIYRLTSDAAKQLNRPCLMIGKGLSRYAEPDRNLLTIDFAPFGWVFPRGGVIVHHGGLNTTAEALRAGVPSLVIPHAYDQFDNAIRTEDMGVSKRLKVSCCDTKKYTSSLQSILKDDDMHDRAKLLSNQMQAIPDGGEVAAEEIIKSLNHR
jgi:UDP:flavonoid glycosyltransferase YjiC (YdhE family)